MVSPSLKVRQTFNVRVLLSIIKPNVRDLDILFLCRRNAIQTNGTIGGLELIQTLSAPDSFHFVSSLGPFSGRVNGFLGDRKSGFLAITDFSRKSAENIYDNIKQGCFRTCVCSDKLLL